MIVSAFKKKFSFILSRCKGFLKINSFDSSLEEGRSKERNHRIALTSVANILSKGVAILISLLTVPLTLNYLGKELYGLWMVISSLVTWLMLSDFGIIYGVTNALAEAFGRGEIDRAKGILSSAFLMMIGISIICFLALLVFHSYIPWGSILNFHDPVLLHLADKSFLIVSTIFLFVLPCEVVKRAFIACQLGFVLSIINCFAYLLSFLGIGIAIYFKLGMLWLVFLVTIGSLIANLALLLFFPRLLPWYKFRCQDVSWDYLRRIRQSSIPLFFYQIGNLSTLQLINVIIARVAGFSVVADYNVISRIYTAIFYIGSCFSEPFYPAIREAFEKKDQEWVLRSVIRVVRIRLIVLVPPALILIFAGDILMKFWIHELIGNGFGLSVWCLFFISLICGAISTTLAEILTSLDEIKSQIKILIFIALIILGGVYFLVPKMGVAGVYLSLAFSAIYPTIWAIKKIKGKMIAQFV